jgi:hypothetical protein
MAIHPGTVDTGFGSTFCLVKFVKCLCSCCFLTREQGAVSTLALFRRGFEEVRNGEYYDESGRWKDMDQRGRNQEDVEKLWKMSEDAYGIKFR